MENLSHVQEAQHFLLGLLLIHFFFKHITHHEAYLNVREQGAFVGVIVSVLV